MKFKKTNGNMFFRLTANSIGFNFTVKTFQELENLSYRKKFQLNNILPFCNSIYSLKIILKFVFSYVTNITIQF